MLKTKTLLSILITGALNTAGPAAFAKKPHGQVAVAVTMMAVVMVAVVSTTALPVVPRITTLPPHLQLYLLAVRMLTPTVK